MKRIVIYILILFYYGCKEDVAPTDENNSELQTSSNLNVSTQIIIDQDFNRQIIANGKIEAQQKSDLRFKVGDRITHINIRNGQRVRKGDVLAYLDNDLLKNEVDKAQIALGKAESKLEEEKINYGVGNQEETAIDDKVLKNLKFKSGVLEASNALDNARLVYNQTFMRAPFSGIVANLEAKTGNYITPSDIFCTLISNTKMEVSFSVLEGEYNAISMNQEVTIEPFTNTSVSYQGEIVEINPLVDENGLITVKALITSKEAKLFDGMNVKILVNSSIKNVVVIPKQALVLRSNREVVFTVDKGLAKWNYVTIAGENSTHYALKKGVKVGDSLIVSGNLNLSHDARVNATLIE